MRALKPTIGVIVSLLLFSTTVLSPLTPGVRATGIPLLNGDYAVYSLGDPPEDCLGTTPLYSALFEFENKSFSGACPGTIRWEVVGNVGSTLEIRFAMSGWPKDRITLEWQYPSEPPNQTLYERIYAALNAEYIIWVDRDTLEATTDEGTYVGRWSFHSSTAEIASEREEVARNWYNGSSISANLSVVKELPLGMSEVLKREYGVDTFVLARTGWISPVPEGIERWLYDLGGGWQQLWPSAPVYDASSTLLLVGLSRFYSDLLFNLYGIFWLDQLTRPWSDARPLTSLVLVDTNIITLPGSTEDDGGGLDDTNDGGGMGGNGSNEGPPWLTIILFAMVAVGVVLLVYLRLRPRRQDQRSASNGTLAGRGDLAGRHKD